MNSESETIRKIIDGDNQQFALLIRAHQGKVLGLCLSLLHSRAEAEDAAQDAFVKAFRSLSSFRQDSSFSTWIYRIAYCRCMDILKEKRHCSEIPGNYDIPEPAATGPSREDRDLVNEALAALPEDYRTILMMKEGAGLSYGEIAAATSLSVEGVRGRLKRARAMLVEKARHFFPALASK